MRDVTNKYARMLVAFECDFSLAKNPDSDFGLADLQRKLESRDTSLLGDIELLKELSYGIRYGKIKIMENGDCEK